MTDAVKSAIWSVDRNLPMDNVKSLDRAMAEPITSARFSMTLLSSFAGIAMILACVGIFGATAYGVAQRSQELAVRLALGATPGDLLWLILREALQVAGVGVVLGLGVALLATRALTRLLFGVTPTDPVTLGVVALGLLTVALVSCLVPALRAANVDPAIPLRS